MPHHMVVRPHFSLLIRVSIQPPPLSATQSNAASTGHFQLSIFAVPVDPILTEQSVGHSRPQNLSTLIAQSLCQFVTMHMSILTKHSVHNCTHVRPSPPPHEPSNFSHSYELASHQPSRPITSAVHTSLSTLVAQCRDCLALCAKCILTSIQGHNIT